MTLYELNYVYYVHKYIFDIKSFCPLSMRKNEFHNTHIYVKQLEFHKLSYNFTTKSREWNSSNIVFENLSKFQKWTLQFLWQQILFQVVPDLYNTKGLECIRSKEKGKEMIKKHIRWNVWVFVVDRLSYLSFYVWSKIYFT